MANPATQCVCEAPCQSCCCCQPRLDAAASCIPSRRLVSPASPKDRINSAMRALRTLSNIHQEWLRRATARKVYECRRRENDNSCERAQNDGRRACSLSRSGWRRGRWRGRRLGRWWRGVSGVARRQMRWNAWRRWRWAGRWCRRNRWWRDGWRRRWASRMAQGDMGRMCWQRCRRRRGRQGWWHVITANKRLAPVAELIVPLASP